ncbi:MAG TPA: thioesterase domain-containing protein [Actinospica sp.]|jgi:thioesterase domain-containing protein|nr:thioesterase domain-containing protein [Actinospica sp.]
MAEAVDTVAADGAVDAVDAVKTLIDVFEQLLDVTAGPEDDFFDLGGYSLLVVEVVDRAAAAGLTITALDVFEHPTPAALAARARGESRDPHAAEQADIVAQVWRSSISPWDPEAPSTLVPLVEEGSDLPLFCVHLGIGHVRLFTGLAREVHGDRPVYGLEAVGYRAAVRPFLSVAETADFHIRQLRTVQPSGPYRLAGLCAGGVIALEMAQQLVAAGERVASLSLLELPSGMPELDPGWGVTEHYEYLIGMLRARFGLHDRVADLPAVLDELKRRTWFEQTDRLDDFYRLTVLWAAAQFAQEHYEPRPYAGPVTICVAEDYAERTRAYWSAILPQAEYYFTDDVRLVEILKDARVIEALRRTLA